MTTDPVLPPEFDRLLDDLAAQPTPVRELWHHDLALMLVDDAKARVINRTRDD